MDKLKVELKITNEFDNETIFLQEQDIEVVYNIVGGHVPYILETVYKALIAIGYPKECIEGYLAVEY